MGANGGFWTYNKVDDDEMTNDSKDYMIFLVENRDET